MEWSVDADGEHAIPHGMICFLQICENDESGVVYEGIQSAEATHGKFDDPPRGECIFQIFVTCSGSSTRCCDLCDDSVCDRRIESAAILRDSCIMYDNSATS